MDKLFPFYLYQNGTRSFFISNLDETTAELANGHFVLSESFILCFFTTDTMETHWISPSQIEWVPQSLLNITPGNYGFVPENMLDFKGLTSEKKFIFLSKDSQKFTFLGQTSVLQVSPSGGKSYGRATFSINPKISLEKWLFFGGYEGWKVNLNNKEILLQKKNGIEKVLKEIGELQNVALYITRYAEDTLLLLINEEAFAFLCYQRFPGDPGLNSKNLSYHGSESDIIEFILENSEQAEIPIKFVISKQMALEAIKYFLEQGQIPDWIKWEEV